MSFLNGTPQGAESRAELTFLREQIGTREYVDLIWDWRNAAKGHIRMSSSAWPYGSQKELTPLLHLVSNDEIGWSEVGGKVE